MLLLTALLCALPYLASWQKHSKKRSLLRMVLLMLSMALRMHCELPSFCSVPPSIAHFCAGWRVR